MRLKKTKVCFRRKRNAQGAAEKQAKCAATRVGYVRHTHSLKYV